MLKDFWAELPKEVKGSTLKVYMAAVQNIHFDWMSPTLSAKKASELFIKYRELY